MYSYDQVPVCVFHVLEGDISQEPSIVDENVDAPKSLQGCIDEFVALLNAVIIGDGFSASVLDLVHDYIRGL